MTRPYFLRCAYVGSGFSGFQIQTTLRSVQGELWRALRAFDPDAPMPQGTGRTDAGVHARAQGVLVQLARDWDPYRLLAAFNAHLERDVRIMKAQAAPEAFFPRAHAVAKRYVYRIQEGPAEDPFLRPFRWHVHGAAPLDRAAMARAASALVGLHDFSTFRHHECAASSTVKRVHAVRLEGEGPSLDLVFEGNRFLMHMVRIMAGTLVEVGKGRIPAGEMPAILAARDRRRAGITAPPHGLCLEEVWYQARWGVGEPSPWPEEEGLS
ncbi:tRNA pseudouridine(38-40) synthase TruA [Mesoterricola sediminis]|uniref:tRNA pseudouridine synthase A n=1 Tax=Mesoterricola sediminis TaxID=2927980 RepID=A0AA48KBK8_9BACT|nr:tRNA pseudouridine(38-40) synthase TruA [Mesoterricola sediminis]BDU76219.1 tRNA pseudouridine synthase A [Mesoterricola sediminis]